MNATTTLELLPKVDAGAEADFAARSAGTPEVVLRAEIDALRKHLLSDIGKDNAANKVFLDGVRDRRAAFLQSGFSLAVKLLAPEHEEFTNALIVEADMAPSADKGTRFTQIAAVQLGMREGKKWVIPGNRHKRIARLYRIFHDNPKDWPMEKIAKNFKALKNGEDGLIKIHTSVVSVEPIKATQRMAVREHGRKIGVVDGQGYSQTAYGDGGFALALVSFNSVGAIVLHDLIKDKKADLTSIRDRFCREQLVLIETGSIINGGADARADAAADLSE